MSKNVVGCKLLDWKSQNFKMEDVDPTAPPNVVKQVNLLHDLWLKLHPDVSNMPTKANNIEVFFNRMKDIGKIVEGTAYDDLFFERMQSQVITGLPGKIKQVLQRPFEGNARDYFNQLNRKSKGYVQDLIANLEVAKKARVLNEATKKLFKDKGIVGADRAQFMWGLYENMSAPYLVEYSLGASVSGQVLLNKRWAKFVEYATGLGVTYDELVDMSKLANDLVQTNYEITALMSQVGSDVTPLLNQGYMSRVLTPGAKEVFDKVSSKGVDSEFENITQNVGKYLQKSRKYNVLLPSDIETVDYFLNKGGILKRINRDLKSGKNPGLTQLAKELGIDSFDSVAQMLNKDGEPFIIETFLNKLKPQELDFFVDTGILSKIPVESGTVLKTLKEHYKLPFDGLDDLFLYDPEQAVAAYTKSLTNLATEKGKLWGYIDGAVQKFGVPASIVDSDPNTYKGFVKLTDSVPSGVLDSITDDVVKSKLDDIYVHPDVARVAWSNFKIHTSPLDLGIIGDTISFVRKTTIGSMLFTTQTFGRNILGNTIYLSSQGVSPIDYMKHFLQRFNFDRANTMKGVVRDYSEVLSDTKIWANGTVSPKEAYQLARRQGLINDANMFDVFDPSASLSARSSQWSRTARMQNWLIKEYPDHFGGVLPNVRAGIRRGIKQADDVVDTTMFKYIGYYNQITDNAAKLAMLEQVMNPNRVQKLVGNGIFDKLPYIEDPKKAIEWVRHRSFMFDDLPNDSQAYKAAQTILPFMSWQYKSMQQTGRYLVEHPATFGSYLKWVSMYKDEFKEDYPVEYYQATEGTPWRTDASPILPYRVPKELSGTGRDEFYVNSWLSMLPQLGSLDTITGLMDDMGMFNDTKIPSDRNDNPFTTKDTNMLRHLFHQNSSNFSEAVYTALMGEDEYGRKLSELEDNPKHRTILGVEVPQTAYYFLTTLAPNIRSIDKIFSYTGASGRSPYLDPTTGEYTTGEPSWTGVVPSYQQANQKPNIFGLFSPITEILGMSNEHIDVYWNMGYYKQGDIQKMIKASDDVIKAYEYQSRRPYDEQHAQQLKLKYEEALLWNFWLRTEWEIVDRWAKSLGIPTRDAIARIQAADLQIPKLLPKSEVDEIARQNYNDLLNYQR